MTGTKPRQGTLVAKLAGELRERIEQGVYAQGAKLPSEAELCREQGVSRTVVREAVASLRADGLVQPRQGSGIYVLERRAPVEGPFQGIDFERVSSMIELLELRTAVEVEAAALAALRRSPQQEELIMDAHRAVVDLSAKRERTADADFALHLAIAAATNNPRFSDFLSLIGPSVIPRHALMGEAREEVSATYLAMLNNEHQEIVSAVLDGDSDGAKAAMRKHLLGSLSRYRSLVRKGL